MKLRSTTRLALPLASAITALFAAQSAHATNYYWDPGTAANGFSTVVGAWNTGSFWNTDSTGALGGPYIVNPTAADDLFIPQATTKTGNLTVTGTKIGSSITFMANVGPTVNITGGTIQIGGTGTKSGIYNASSGNNTVSTPLTINSTVSSISISNSGAGTLKTSNVTGLASTGTTQTVNIGTSSGAITLNGAFADSAAGGKVALNFNSSGAGITTLQVAGSYTGGTTFTAGTAVVTDATIMPTSGGVTFNGGTLQLKVGTGGWTTGQIDTLLGLATKTSGNLGLDTTNGDLTQWTNFSTSNLGGLGLTKVGANTLILDQNNSYTGATTITTGTVQVGSGGSTGSLGSSSGVSLAGNTTLLFNRTGSLTFTGNITGSPTTAAVTITGGLNLTLSGTNNFLGALNVQNGTISFTDWNNNLTGNAGLTLGGTAGLGAGTGTLEFTSSSNYTSSSTATTNKAITLYAGGTGVVQIDNAAAVVNLSLGSGNPQVSGSGNLLKTGQGTLILSNIKSSYSGTTTIQAGSLVAGGNAPSGAVGAFGNATSAIVLGNGSTLVGDAPGLLAGAQNGSPLVWGTASVGRDITVGSVSNTAAYNATLGSRNPSGTSSFTGNITLSTTATNYTVTLQAATGGTVDFQGTWNTNGKDLAIGSTGNTGTVKLSSSVTNVGNINVNYGTLMLAGAFTNNISSAPKVLVGSGTTLDVTGLTSGTLVLGSTQTLLGSGTISGTTIVNGILSPGDATNTIGRLAASALTLTSGSSFTYQLNSNTLAGDFQVVSNTNGLTLDAANGTLLNISDLGSTALAPGTVVSLMNYAGTLQGGYFTLAGPNTPLLPNTQFTLGLNTWKITYADATGGSNVSNPLGVGSFINLTTLTAVPEPGSLLAIGCLVGSGALLRNRRRHS